MLNPDLFSDWIFEFKSLFPSHPFTDKAYQLYYSSLKGWDNGEFNRVCEEIYANERFFPTLAKFNDYRKKRFEGLINEWIPTLLENAQTPLDSIPIPDTLKTALKTFPNWSRYLSMSEDNFERFKGKILEVMVSLENPLCLPPSDYVHQRGIETGNYYFFKGRKVYLHSFDNLGRALVSFDEKENQRIVLSVNDSEKISTIQEPIQTNMTTLSDSDVLKSLAERVKQKPKPLAEMMVKPVSEQMGIGALLNQFIDEKVGF